MRIKQSVWGIVLAVLLLLAGPAAAEVDYQIVQTLNIDGSPLATEVAPEGSISMC